MSKERAALHPLAEPDKLRTGRTKSLLLQLYPTFAEELSAPEGAQFSKDDWHQAVDLQSNRLFPEAMVRAADDLFDSCDGKQLLVRFSIIEQCLQALRESPSVRQLSESCVQNALGHTVGSEQALRVRQAA